MTDSILACVTAVAGIVLILLTAGPGSGLCFSFRLVLWSMAVSLIGASVERLVAFLDPDHLDQVRTFSHGIMIAARVNIILAAGWLCWQWRRHHQKAPAQEPRENILVFWVAAVWFAMIESVGNWVAGYRR